MLSYIEYIIAMVEKFASKWAFRSFKTIASIQRRLHYNIFGPQVFSNLILAHQSQQNGEEATIHLYNVTYLIKFYMNQCLLQSISNCSQWYFASISEKATVCTIDCFVCSPLLHSASTISYHLAIQPLNYDYPGQRKTIQSKRQSRSSATLSRPLNTSFNIFLRGSSH